MGRIPDQHLNNQQQFVQLQMLLVFKCLDIRPQLYWQVAPTLLKMHQDQVSCTTVQASAGRGGGAGGESKQLQWGLEYQTLSVFDWSKVTQILNKMIYEIGTSQQLKNRPKWPPSWISVNWFNFGTISMFQTSPNGFQIWMFGIQAPNALYSNNNILTMKCSFLT